VPNRLLQDNQMLQKCKCDGDVLQVLLINFIMNCLSYYEVTHVFASHLCEIMCKLLQESKSSLNVASKRLSLKLEFVENLPKPK
jgi:hypothetical protein